MKKLVMISSAVLAVILVAVLINQGKEPETNTERKENLIERVKNGEMTARAVVNYFSEKRLTTEYMGRITSEEVIVNSGEEEYTVDLKEDEFYIAIAPYKRNTHPCQIHNLVTCQGEIVNKEVDVRVETENGEVIIDKEMTTLESGFIELWLPKNKDFKITIKYDGLEAREEIGTFEGDDTCLTTMKLS